MKKGAGICLVFAVLFFSVFVIIFNLNFVSANLNDGLIAYYNFDSDGVNYLKDMSVNNYHGSCTSGRCPNRVGTNHGFGAKFDGKNDRIKFPFMGLLNNKNKVTVSYWINVASTTYGTGVIFQQTGHRCLGGDSGSCYYWAPYIQLKKLNQFNYLINFNTGDVCQSDDHTKTATTDVPLRINEWYHITHVYDGTASTFANKYKAYVNDASGNAVPIKVSGNVANIFSDIAGKTIQTYSGYYDSYDNTCNLRLNNPGPIDGILDELKIYNRALTEPEINCLYNPNLPACTGTPPTTCGEQGQACCQPPSIFQCRGGLECDINNECQPIPQEHRCSGEKQIIMRLDYETNAHGEIFNGGNNYPQEICYNEIFNDVEYTGTNPHDCDSGNPPTNKVVGLNAEGHAQIPSRTDTDYPAVCYGDLTCTLRQVPCNADEKEVVSLSGDTNAHLSSSLGGYDRRICCKSAFASQAQITEAKWTNMIDEEITNADLNDRVRLKISGIGLGGKEIEYKIEKETTSWIFFKKWTERAIVSSATNAEWVANEPGKFRFIAKAIDGSTNEKTSNELVVSDTISNSPPVAIIVNPENRENYFKTETIDYNQESYDVDDHFDYTWDFGDGQSIGGNSRNNANYNTQHNYATGGQKNISLSVVDERGASDIDKVSILVKDDYGIYVFVDISRPLEGEAFTANTIPFNAAGSFAEEYSASGLVCLTGNCPATAHDGTVIQNSPNSAGFSNLAFNWTFADMTTKTGMGMAGADFNKQILVNGRQTAKLNVSISFDATRKGSSEKSVEFIISAFPLCENGNSWKLADGSSSSSLSDCFRSNGNPSQICCPANAPNCSSVGSNRVCVASAVTACAGYYTTENECNNRFSPEIANADVEANILIPGGWQAGACTTGSKCIGVSGSNCLNDCINSPCICRWVVDASGNGNCTPTASIVRSNSCGGGGGGSSGTGSCSMISATATDCVDSERSVKMNYKWESNSIPPLTAPTWCMNKTSNVPCLSGEVLISFFGFWNLIIAMLAIIFVYFYYILKHNNA